jgi:hypothetical protein
MIAALWRHAGRYTVWADVAALLGVALVAFTGFFKVLGIWNNLTILTAVTIPYAAALLGLTVATKKYTTRTSVLATVSFVALFAFGISLQAGPKQIADDKIEGEMQALSTFADQLCASKQTILVTQFPDVFFDCPTASYALVPSYAELQVAFPRYYAGPSVFDETPNARYLIASGVLPLTAAWAHRYHAIKSLPVVSGWGANYFPFDLKVYERD